MKHDFSRAHLIFFFFFIIIFFNVYILTLIDTLSVVSSFATIYFSWFLVIILISFIARNETTHQEDSHV